MKTLTIAAGALSAVGLSLAAALPAHAAITTFATISALSADNLYFKNASSTNKSASALVYSIANSGSKVPGAANVNFSFINEGATLDTAVSNVAALFTLSASVTNTPAEISFGYLIQSGVSGTFSLKTAKAITVNQTTYAAGSNLLTGKFTGAGIAGPGKTTSGSLDANNQNVGSSIIYTSDFLTFNPTASVDGAFSLTSITPALSDVQAGVYALKSFKTDASGSFSADPVPTVNGVPEPASWALMLIGFGSVGALARRRKTIVLG